MRKILLLFVSIILLINSSFSQIDSTSKKPKHYKPFIAPAALLGLGYYSRYSVPLGRKIVRDFRNKHFPKFHNELDDPLQFVPIVFAYGLGVLPNMKSKSNFVNKTILLAKSELMMMALVYPLKKWVGDRRPDSGTRNAWPSGHTTQAFVAAAFLDHEYRHKSIWISVASYTCATSVAVLRILNDRHWSADVLAGAGLGILVTNVAYWTHQYKWNNFKFLEGKEVSLLPYYQNGGGGFMASIKL